MCNAEASAPVPEAETAAPVPEIYKGDEIESILIFGNKVHPESIGIRLKNNKYIEVVPILKVFSDRHQSQLELKRGGWLR